MVFNGGFEGLSAVLSEEKSKKLKLRRLSVVERGKEMGSFVDEQHLLLSPPSVNSNNFKLHNLIFDDCNPVDHPSVPRKLRSAMKKRTCKSNSAPLTESKRLNLSVNGFDSPQSDTKKRSKLSTQNGGLDNLPIRSISARVSKDEQEVAETLFALAGMIPSSDFNSKKESKGESSEGKQMDPSNKREDSWAVSEVPKKEQEIIYGTTSSERTILAPAADGPMKDTAEKVLPPFVAEAKLSESITSVMNVNSSLPQQNLWVFSSRSEISEEKSSRNLISSSTSAGVSVDNRSNELKQEKSLLFERKSDLKFSAVDVTRQKKQEQATCSTQENGLYVRGADGFRVDQTTLQPSTALFPAWTNNAVCLSKQSSHEHNSIFGEKGSKNNRGKLRKRCATHMYITRLIQALQTSEGNNIHASEANQIHMVKNRLNGTVTASHLFVSPAENNCHEAAPGLLLHEQQDQKQSFDFLSLCTGVGDQEANGGSSGLGINVEPLAKGSAAYLYPVAHQNSLYVQQNRYSSNPYQDHVTAKSALIPPQPQVHLQPPPHLATHMGAPQMSTTAAPPHPPPHHHHHHQIWAAQLAARYKQTHLAKPHMPNWQNSRLDPHSSVQYTQALLPPLSQPSMDVLGPKYNQISQQKQQVMPLGSSRVKSQRSQLPSGCEEGGIRFSSDGVLPLQQLLCSEGL